MGSRDHYISQFHLRGFTDKQVGLTQEPWLWIGDCKTKRIFRKSPKKFSWERNAFDGPGTFEDGSRRLEAFLAEKVEGPAASALRSFLELPCGTRAAIPPELTRY